jgi:hypothetical protein
VDEIEEYSLTFPIAFSYTLPLLWLEGDGHQMGAGVLVQVGARMFVATAAHCMPPGVTVIDEKGFSIPPAPSKITVVKRGADDDIDIGFLELEPDDSFRSLGKSYCSLAQLSTAALPAGGMCHVVCDPEGGSKVVGRRTLEVVKQGFGSTYQGQEGDYFLFPYPKEGWTHGVGSGWEKAKFHDTPRGFSGGGLWAFIRPAQGEMFNPERAVKLMGIQSAWWIERRLVKCVPIVRWLELVHGAYPDLRWILEGQFPCLAVPAARVAGQ